LFQRGLLAQVDSTAPVFTNQPGASQTADAPESTVNRDVIQEAIERLRREAGPAATQSLESASAAANVIATPNSEAIESRLSLVEQTLKLQHESELEALHSSNRTLLLAAGILAGVVLAGILCGVLVLTRALSRFARLTTRLRAEEAGGDGRSLPILATDELSPGTFSHAEEINSKFLDAVERLEKRILGLEQTSGELPARAFENRPPFGQMKKIGGKPTIETAEVEPQPGAGGSSQNEAHGRRSGLLSGQEKKASEIAILLGKGQALLNLDKVEEALKCFDRAVMLDPANAESFLKLGMALEKLHKMDEAIKNYDRAIAADSSMTQAYLYKGAACNRLQRFREALDCYEKALKMAPRPVAS
jgi:hypothetical protein